MSAPHDLQLLSTIAASLSAAFFCGLAATRLKMPPIVGYLLAGILIGPHTPGFVGNLKVAEELSEIGIVLLMFGVGLHFSVKDLLEVRKIAVPGAVVQIAAAVAMGAGVATQWWGWDLRDGLLFGLALSVASTVVLLRSLEEHELLQTLNGRIAIGWLIVEDLAMVLALVLVPTLVQLDTGGGGDPLTAIAISIGKLLAFFAAMFIAGKNILPWLLTQVARTRSRELFTLAVFAAALGVAFGASQLFGVSFALGAFFAGMMIRESDLNHEVADRALPFQDAFAVLFFVSVGMLFDPNILFAEPLKVLVVVSIIMFGKSLAAFLIVMLFRYPAKTGLLVSSGLAQIGEFSFVLAALGVTYGILSEEGRNLILAGALVSIALNPLMFHLAQLALAIAGRNPRLSSIFNLSDRDLSHLRRGEKKALRDTVILVGYGRTGEYIAQNLQDMHVDLVIIESNREKVDLLRIQGKHAIASDGTHPNALRAAAIEKAMAIIICIPSPFEARGVLENARALNPDIRTLVLAHNDEEASFFEKQHTHLTVTGQREAARRLADYIGKLQAKPVH